MKTKWQNNWSMHRRIYGGPQGPRAPH